MAILLSCDQPAHWAVLLADPSEMVPYLFDGKGLDAVKAIARRAWTKFCQLLGFPESGPNALVEGGLPHQHDDVTCGFLHHL